MEGISIIPREGFEDNNIGSPVSDLGMRIVDPGDPSNNLVNGLKYEQDLLIRNESLRAISLIESHNYGTLLIENPN
jgi:hypothetical protein